MDFMNKILKTEDINVVILCGGLGKRLRSIIADRPKPMAEVKNRPFLDILIRYVSSYGFKRFILCTGYKGEMIRRYYKAGGGDLKIVFSEEKEPLGTGGALKNAENFIQSDVFLSLNGDSFCQMNMQDFLAFHRAKKAELSIALAAIEKDADYGVVSLGSNNRIVSFNEKGVADGNGFINAGVYLFNKDVLKSIPSDKKYSLEYELFPNILHKGIYGYITHAELIDIGTPERYETAKEFFEDRYLKS